MIEKIKENKEKLDSIASILKSKYRGIDNVIDEIIEKIEVWYTFDEVLYKPTVICLWGTTGVGKTNLIRDLIKLLDMYEKFCEIDVSRTIDPVDGRRNNGSRRFYGGMVSSISSKLFSVIENADEKAILLIDEITKIDFKNNSGRFSDVWNLLSDGRTGDGVSILSKFDDYISDLNFSLEEFDTSHNWNEFSKSSPTPDGGYNPSWNPWNPHTESIPMNRNYLIRKLDLKNFEELSPIFDFIDFNPYIKSAYPFGCREYFRRAYDAGEISLQDILKTPGLVYVKSLIKVVELVQKRTVRDLSETTSGKDPLVMSKLLIFIAGNVDGLYVDSSDTEIDADTLHKNTLNITKDQLKKELLKCFKPEEVARLGGNDIVYPSLSSAAFRSIIVDNLKIIENDTFNSTGVHVSLSSELFLKHLYNTCVVASQGARPLISKLQTEVSRILPKLVKHALVNNMEKISITILNGKF